MVSGRKLFRRLISTERPAHDCLCRRWHGSHQYAACVHLWNHINKSRIMLTADRLRKILHYDPETGIFRWLNPPACSVRRGDIAGHFHKKLGYIFIGIDNCKQCAHRLAWLYMTGEWPTKWIDHANGDRRDNSFKNLRHCTPSQNISNSKRHKTSTSGLKGASWDEQTKKWRVRIRSNGKNYCGGRFTSPEEAHAVYCAMAKRLNGEFFRSS